MVDIPKKDSINMLLPIDNIFGSHEGRMAPVIIYILVVMMPIGVYLFVLLPFLPWQAFLLIEALWSARMALFILCHENEKMADFQVQSGDEYKSAKDLIRISHMHSHGLIEYQNTMVAIVVSGLTNTYLDDTRFSKDYTDFLKQLDEFDVDYYLHMITQEFSLQSTSENLRVYENKELMQERMKFYKDNDDFVDRNSMMWQHNFLIKTSKYNWKHMMETVEDLIGSSQSKVFHKVWICNPEQVSEVMSRDIGAFVDLNALLREKYVNDEYFGSEVLYYGDDIPEEFRPKKEEDSIEDRRVVEEE